MSPGSTVRRVGHFTGALFDGRDETLDLVYDVAAAQAKTHVSTQQRQTTPTLDWSKPMPRINGEHVEHNRWSQSRNYIIILYYATRRQKSKKYKRQVRNKTYKNRKLQNRQQENITVIYTQNKQKSVNPAQVIRL